MNIITFILFLALYFSYQNQQLFCWMVTILAKASSICKRRWRNIVRPSTRQSCRSCFRDRLNLKKIFQFKVKIKTTIYFKHWFLNFNLFLKNNNNSSHVSNCWQRSRQSLCARCCIAAEWTVDVERDATHWVGACVAQFGGARGTSDEFDSWLWVRRWKEKIWKISLRFYFNFSFLLKINEYRKYCFST